MTGFTLFAFRSLLLILPKNLNILYSVSVMLTRKEGREEGREGGKKEDDTHTHTQIFVSC